MTDAFRSGMPPHMAARICGHQTVDTTLGYAAIYLEDVVNHHLSFIARCRTLRPWEEYREPTAQEWQDFLTHFELRKTAPGVRARDFGTPCVHEHACIRCPVLRPDPEQMPRLEEIHANLLDRLQEAKQQRWLGEVTTIEASLATQHTTIHLGMPDLRGAVACIDSEQRNEDARQQS
ncbi:integrase [Streptomyces sp. NPDC057235]|uniref:integrase n=1 Tax=Streptomyces sp. NPDC057235 TaxID=3346058 RepID=UPI00363254C7